MTVEELNVIVSANKDDFDRKIRMVNENLVNVKKQAEDTSAGTLSAFKTLASGLSALGFGAMIKNAISLAGDLQQNIGGSESVQELCRDNSENRRNCRFFARTFTEQVPCDRHKNGITFSGFGLFCGTVGRHGNAVYATSV